jgi:hypothetical protein
MRNSEQHLALDAWRFSDADRPSVCFAQPSASEKPAQKRTLGAVEMLLWRPTVDEDGHYLCANRTMTGRPVALGAEPQRPRLLQFSTTACM